MGQREGRRLAAAAPGSLTCTPFPLIGGAGLKAIIESLLDDPHAGLAQRAQLHLTQPALFADFRDGPIRPEWSWQ